MSTKSFAMRVDDVDFCHEYCRTLQTSEDVSHRVKSLAAIFLELYPLPEKSDPTPETVQSPETTKRFVQITDPLSLTAENTSKCREISYRALFRHMRWFFIGVSVVNVILSIWQTKSREGFRGDRHCKHPRSICFTPDNSNLCATWALYDIAAMDVDTDITHHSVQCAQSGGSPEFRGITEDGGILYVCVDKAKRCHTQTS